MGDVWGLLGFILGRSPYAPLISPHDDLDRWAGGSLRCHQVLVSGGLSLGLVGDAFLVCGSLSNADAAGASWLAPWFAPHNCTPPPPVLQTWLCGSINGTLFFDQK